MFQAFDASGDSRGIRHVYNLRGYVSQLKESREGTAGQVYWTVQTMNARGQVTGALMGNGTQITASHDPATGAVLQLMDATGTAMAQDLFMAWDALGNLTSRRDWSGNRNQEEQFFYDARNRLTRTDSRVNGGTWVANRQVQTYNVAGNMLTKTGLGTYTYGSTRPHAVTSAGGVTYTYDANGNVISDTSGRAFAYTTYDLVRRVSQGTAHTEFHYDAGRQRTLKRELSGTTVTSRTHYLGSVEVVWNGSSPGTGVGQYRRTIGGVVINTFYQSTGVSQQRYLHRDHLGSIVAISDEAGQIVTWMGFDPWGLRRNADAWHPWNAPPSVYLNAMLAITPRGFTGHEHVDAAGIIHMNGRIYDPHLGRFLQADPFVEDSTTLNRYTYVHNNPLAYTDPSGYFSLKKIFKLAAVIAIGVYTGGVGIGIFSMGTISGGMAGFGVAVAGGALAGGISAGSLEGALWGAFTAAVFTGIGAHVKGLAEASTIIGVFGSGLSAGQFATAAVGSGVAGGTLSELQGGKFGHGFLSAGVGFTAGAGIARIGNPVGRGVATAVLGGTVSKVTGGKFGNGALTAAMAFSIGELTQRAANGRTAITGNRTVKVNGSDADVVSATIDYTTSYENYGDAMTALDSEIVTARDNGNSDWEYGGIAVRKDNAYYISEIVTSRHKHAIAWDLNSLDAIAQSAQIVALHHYHPLHRGVVPRAFSDSDTGTFRSFRTTYGNGFQAIYMRDRHGIRKFDGSTGYRGISCRDGIASC